MIGKALNSDNDIFLENGQFALVEEGAETVQHVRTRLLFYRGEWFLDLEAGVPYFEEIFVKPVNLANVESILKQTILQTDGVERLLTFSLDYENTTRKLTVEFSAETIYGLLEGVTINV